MDGEHEAVMDTVSKQFDMPAETMFVVFDHQSNDTIKQTLEEIESLQLTSSIDSPLEDQSLQKEDVAYAMLHFDHETDHMSQIVTDIRATFDGQDGITLTGASPLSKDINEASQKDLITAEAIGLPVAIIILLFAFGTVVAALVPLAIGITTFIGEKIDLSIFVLNIIPMLGLALSIDFALLFISRYREERAHSSIEDAVKMTIQTAGRSVIFSAFCVFIGLGAMLLIQIDLFQNIAIGGMIVVSMAVLTSITLLPSILLLLGNRIDKWQVLKTKKNGTNRWRQFANSVIKRPVTITL